MFHACRFSAADSTVGNSRLCSRKVLSSTAGMSTTLSRVVLFHRIITFHVCQFGAVDSKVAIAGFVMRFLVYKHFIRSGHGYCCVVVISVLFVHPQALIIMIHVCLFCDLIIQLVIAQLVERGTVEA